MNDSVIGQILQAFEDVLDDLALFLCGEGFVGLK